MCLRYLGLCVRYLSLCVRYLRLCVRYLRLCVRYLSLCARYPRLCIGTLQPVGTLTNLLKWFTNVTNFGGKTILKLVESLFCVKNIVTTRLSYFISFNVIDKLMTPVEVKLTTMCYMY